MSSVQTKGLSIKELREVLAQFHEDYVLYFVDADEDKRVVGVKLEVVEGTTSDGPGSVDLKVVYEPKLTIKIVHDDDCTNPRDNDNVGVMYCKHSRYDLGDKDADDPWIEEAGKSVDGIFVTEDEYGYIVDMLRAYVEDIHLSDDEAAAITDVLQDLEDLTWIENRRLRDNVVLCLPIYIYDHSGITLSHGKFSCPWDSGQVGWHYTTKESVANTMGTDATEEDIRRALDCDLDEYNNYVQGNCWGFIVKDENDDDVESCWGFIGDDWGDVKHMMEHCTAIPEAQWREAWEARFE